METPGSRRVGLEVVRALAALLVVYNHVFTFGLLPKTGILELPAQFATEAVIIFFVLSGTVITLSAERRSTHERSRRAALASYLRARLMRIYPIYLLGLALAVLVQVWLEGSGMPLTELLGNALFLQTLSGYVVPTPRYNPPLWSLANEVFYYLLFAVSFFVRQTMIAWAVVAAVTAAFLYPPRVGGLWGHLIFVLGLSLPWIMGHWIAAYRDRLPRISVPLGFAFFVIALCYARVQLTREFYDAFRLTAFGACCCPLILSLIQEPARTEPEPERHGWRFAVASIGIAALWAVSPSLLVVKVALSVACLLFSALRLGHIRAALGWFRALLSPLAYVGSISYALYALHVPLIFIVNKLLAGTPVGLRLAAFALVALAVSHVAERVVQPRLSSRGGPRGATRLGST